MGVKGKTIFIAILLLVLSASAYYLYKDSSGIGLTKPTLELKISTDLSDGMPRITNITFEQSSVVFFYKATESIPKFPEIDVNARLNEFESGPSTYYASAPFDFSKINETYNIKLFFRDGKVPKQGDILILPIRITGYTGAVLYKTTAFYDWT